MAEFNRKIDPRIARVGTATALLAVSLLAKPACASLPFSQEPTPTRVPVVKLATPEPTQLPIVISPTPAPTLVPTHVLSPTPTIDAPPQFSLPTSFTESYRQLTNDFSALESKRIDRQPAQSLETLAGEHVLLLHKQVAVLKSQDPSFPIRLVDRHTMTIGQDSFDLYKLTERLYVDAIVNAAVRERLPFPTSESERWLNNSRYSKGVVKRVEDSARFLRDKIIISYESERVRIVPTDLIELANGYRLLEKHGRNLPNAVLLRYEYQPDLATNPNPAVRLDIFNSGVTESIGLYPAQTDRRYFEDFRQAKAAHYGQAGNAIENYEYGRVGDDHLKFYYSDEEAFWTTLKVFIAHGQQFRDRVNYMRGTGHPSAPLYEAAYKTHKKHLGFETLIEGVEKDPRELRTGDTGYVFEYEGTNWGVTLNEYADSDRRNPLQLVPNGSPVRIVDGSFLIRIPHPYLFLQTTDMVAVEVNGQQGYMAVAYISPSRR